MPLIKNACWKSRRKCQVYRGCIVDINNRIDEIIRDIEAVKEELANLRERLSEAGLQERERLQWDINSRKEELRILRSVLMRCYQSI